MARYKKESRGLREAMRFSIGTTLDTSVLASNRDEVRKQMKRTRPNFVITKMTRGERYPTSGRYAHIIKYRYRVKLKMRMRRKSR